MAYQVPIVASPVPQAPRVVVVGETLSDGQVSYLIMAMVGRIRRFLYIYPSKVDYLLAKHHSQFSIISGVAYQSTLHVSL